MRTISLVYLFIVAVFSVVETNAQSGWYPQTSDTEQHLRAVAFIRGNTGTTVGDSGIILYTTDGGTNWIRQTSGTLVSLRGIVFANTTTSTAVGDSGIILRTTDAGTTWGNQQSNTQHWLSSITVTDSTTGWTVGEGGTILHTTDGGNTWIGQSSGTTEDLHSVYFANHTMGWSVGAGGTILHTTDGGTLWSDQSSGTTAHLRSVHFVDNNSGWIAGEGGTILHTTDGGDIWSGQSGGTSGDCHSVYFADSNTGWTAGKVASFPWGGGGTILRTIDAGATWITQWEGSWNGLLGVCFTGVDTGTAVGEGGMILRTINGGGPRVRRVPQGYSTVQSAIDAACAGDTVLMDHGTYYENIAIGKSSIVVGSNYLLDSDTSHIGATIINGSTPHHPDSGSTVTFDGPADTSSVICGLTITGGSGSAGTIDGWPSRTGGGIAVRSGASIRQNRVTVNQISTSGWAMGGGIVALLDSVDWIIVEDNQLTGNSVSSTLDAATGGAIQMMGGNARILRNTISGNASSTQATNWNAWAGGISIVDADVLIANNVLERNTTRAPNCSMYQSWGGGLMTYSVNLDFLNNRVVDNLVETPGGGRGGGVSVATESVSGLRDALLSSNYIASNRVVGGVARGGGVYVLEQRPRLENNVIVGNRALYGGAFGASKWNTLDGASDVVSPRFKARYTDRRANRTHIAPDAPVLINNTIAQNSATTGMGGAVWSSGSWVPTVMNTIAFGDTGTSEIYTTGGSGITVCYSNIQGGYAGTGNIDAEPYLAADGSSLSDTSACIGAGIDSINLGGVWYTAPPYCMRGLPRPSPPWSMPDIGACESWAASANARMILLAPDSLAVLAGELDTAIATLAIQNFGGRVLEWSIRADSVGSDSLSWISVSPPSGTTFPAGETQVTVTMRAIQPVGSIQHGLLTISSNDTVAGLRVLPVALSVGLSAQIEPGWNMVSVPLSVADYTATVVFPSAVSNAYHYNSISGYYMCLTLTNGFGYWMKFPAGEKRTVGGVPIQADTLAVEPGWNLIGSISFPVPVDSIRSIPGGMEISPVWTYAAGAYAVTDILRPLRGYWVKAASTGSLILAAIPPPLTKVQVRPTGELPPAPPGEPTEQQSTMLPAEFALLHNYPNPFNPTTIIEFRIQNSELTILKVFDLLGREVGTLVNEVKEPGTYTVQWDASGVSSGVYFYRLQAGTFVATRKLLLLR